MELIVFWGGCLVVGAIIGQSVATLVVANQRARLLIAEKEYIDREWQLRLSRAEYELRQTQEQSRAWSGWRKFRVAKRVPENESGEICSFYLEPHDRKPLAEYRPGQFIMLQLEISDADGRTTEEVRCYSLSTCPYPDHYRISVRKIVEAPGIVPGVVSTYLHDSVQEGELIDVATPSGDFYLDLVHDTPTVLIAGGVGITPILAMLSTLAASQSTRPVSLFYGVRTMSDAAFIGEIERVAHDLPHCKIYIAVSDESRPSERPPNPDIEFRPGRIDIGMLRECLPALNNEYYICGPLPMMQGIRAALCNEGVSEQRIHYEAFAPEETPRETESVAVAEGQLVEFAASGSSATWQGEPSIFEMARANNLGSVRIKYSCRQGKCGTCITAIRSGNVVYPGAKPACDGLEEGYCLPCICVPDGALVLDA